MKLGGRKRETEEDGRGKGEKGGRRGGVKGKGAERKGDKRDEEGTIEERRKEE